MQSHFGALLKSLGNLVRICIHFEAGGWRHLIKLESGCKAEFSAATHPSYSIIAPAKQRGEGDKSQGRVYEMSSGECKRMIRDATGCNAVRRGRSRCNQMSFKDVTWLVARPAARITPAREGGEGRGWGVGKYILREDTDDYKMEMLVGDDWNISKQPSLKFKSLWTKGTSADNRQSRWWREEQWWRSSKSELWHFVGFYHSLRTRSCVLVWWWHLVVLLWQ